MLNDVLRVVKQLGRGGMGAVYVVEAVRDSPGYTRFLSDIIAWREAITKEELFSNQLKTIRSTQSMLETLVRKEMVLQQSGAGIDEIYNIKEDILSKKDKRIEFINQMRAGQITYATARRDELKKTPAEELVMTLRDDYGIVLPSDSLFAAKLSLAKDESSLKRLKDEWKSLIGLNHENIVSVYSGGENYYVMELIRNFRGVKYILEKYTINQKIGIVIQAANGLAEAHNQGIVHRDIKPDNLFTFEDNKGIHTKVGDFGLAKTADFGTTFTGMIAGTPYYMSPEQIDNTKNCTMLSDVYSLGATLYHLITGKAPYHLTNEEGINLFQLGDKIRNEMTIMPRSIDPNIPPDLEDMICVMIEKDPSQRPQSMEEVAEMLNKYLAEEDSSALDSVNFSKLGSARLDKRVDVVRRKKIKKDKTVDLIEEKKGYNQKPAENKAAENIQKERKISYRQKAVEEENKRRYERKDGKKSFKKWLYAGIGAIALTVIGTCALFGNNKPVDKTNYTQKTEVKSYMDKSGIEKTIDKSLKTETSKTIAKTEEKTPYVDLTPPSLEGAVLYMTFDEGTVVSGDGIDDKTKKILNEGNGKNWYVKDLSPKGNHGEIKGKFAVKDGKPVVYKTFEEGYDALDKWDLFLVKGQSGKPGDYAMGFGARQGYILIPNSEGKGTLEDHFVNKSFKIALDVNPKDKQKPYATLFTNEDTQSPYPGICIHYYGGKFEFTVVANSIRNLIRINPPKSESWSNLNCSFDLNKHEGQILCEGSLAKNSLINYNGSSSKSFTIGTNPNKINTSFFLGILDHLRIE